MATRKTSGNAGKPKVSGHSVRRPRLPNGQRQPRKLYAYQTAEQKKGGMAPGMGRMYTKGRKAEIEAVVNADPSILDSSKRLSRQKAKGISAKLATAWAHAERSATRGRNLANVMDDRDMNARDAKRAIIGACYISFGADPRSR